MALFTYQAFTKDGKKVSSAIDAPTLDAARLLLQQQSLYIISLP